MTTTRLPDDDDRFVRRLAYYLTIVGREYHDAADPKVAARALYGINEMQHRIASALVGAFPSKAALLDAIRANAKGYGIEAHLETALRLVEKEGGGG